MDMTVTLNITTKTLSTIGDQIEELLKMRRLEIERLREDGWTLDAIGKEYGLSRQRVLQILVS